MLVIEIQNPQDINRAFFFLRKESIMNQFKKHNWFTLAVVCFIALSAVSTTTGCAGKTKTSTVTTQTSDSGAGTSSVTTQKETVTSAHPRGVIGGIFYTIGQVLLWPFRVIGSLF